MLNSNSFTSAWDLQSQQRFKFGLEQLDELIPNGILTGSLTLIQGELPRYVLRRLITDLTVSLLLASSRDIAFIDGANVFPFYEISVEAKKRGFDPIGILDRIQLARAFNFHQMTEILTKRLPQLLTIHPCVKIVLIPQISSQYLSQEALQYLQYDKLTFTTSILELTSALGKLKSLVLRHDLLGIMTAESAPHSRHKALGGTYLAHCANQVIRADVTPGKTRSEYDISYTLEQDPEMPRLHVIHETRNNHSNEHTIMPLNHFWK
jgi:hypothetical protein